MVSRLLALLLFLVILFDTHGQSPVPDSISARIRNHPNDDTAKVLLLNKLSYDYRWIDFSLSQQFAEQSLKIAKHLDFKKGIATADYRVAHCYWALGENELAIQKGLESATIAEQEHYAEISVESFLILARAYLDQREINRAELYINKAEKTALQIKNADLLSRVYNLAGVVEFVKNNIDSALLLYTKALSIVETQQTSKSHLAQITSNIGECYTQNNPDQALQYFTKALAIAKARESRNRSAEATITGIIGNIFTKKKKYKDADKYLCESLRLSRALGLKRSIRNAYAGLVNLKIEEGKSSEALAYLKKYYAVHDSLLNVTKTRQIVELETRHELEKKEHAIQLLERDNKIQILWTNILISVFVLFGLLSVALYYLQEVRDKKNRMILNLEIDQLTTQNKELSEKYKDVLASGNAKSIESSDQRLLKKAIEVVERNIGDPLFGVEQMSRELGMSRTNMHRKIKAITGFPPSELIRNIRLRKAAALLLNNADTVSQIGLIVGFEDHSYFSKSFKKQFGVTPSEYIQSRENQN